MTTRDRLLETIPDKPLWVETRGALLDDGEVFGEPGAAVVRNARKDTLCLVGRPEEGMFELAFEGAAETVQVIAQAADREHGEMLMDLPGSEARIYTATRPPRAPPAGDYILEDLSKVDLGRLRHLPGDLIEELEDVLSVLPVVAAVVDDMPVSFCYPVTRTEHHWDVSVDTWEPYRRRGFAAAAFGGMYERMLGGGRRAVWGAMEWNEASWRLATKLELEEVGSVYVWTAHTLPQDDSSEEIDLE